MNDPINVVTCTDDNYAQHLGVMLCSLIENHSPQGRRLQIYIIDGGINGENKAKLKNLERSQVTITFVEVNKELYKSFVISLYVSHAAYYRISIPEILGPQVHKAIYLDSDMVILNDIEKLWDVDLGPYFLAAVWSNEFTPKLEFSVGSKYFNSGVMVLDLVKFRENRISEKVRAFIEKNRKFIRWWDQDGLNGVLYDKWMELDQRWNRIVESLRVKDNSFFALEKGTAKLIPIERPTILHYASEYKPWQYAYRHPLKSYYFEYLKKTPWHDFKPTDKTLKNQILCFVLDHFPRFLITPLQNSYRKFKELKHDLERSKR